ncbi:MAG: AAA family ATPase [Candidatus Pacebacteria bacterium]|nr:AAA family ATPase [Candidatus Paceibacterota bacterium]
MKIKTLQISNIASFKYVEDIESADKIEFKKDINILIGSNGSGKSTMLEVINFIFKRIIFIPYTVDGNLYKQRNGIDINQKKNILKLMSGASSCKDFLLERNYDFQDKTQKIRMILELDEIDKENIEFLKNNKEKFSRILGKYSTEQVFKDENYSDEYVLDIELDSESNTFSIKTKEDLGFIYLKAYNLYKEVIEIYNQENPKKKMNNLAESLILIGSYRNYSNYSRNVSLANDNTAKKQIQDIKNNNFSRSVNQLENSEPSIFNLVRLRMAEKCFDLISQKKDQQECEDAANKLSFVRKVNEKLKIVNLKMRIKLINLSSWQYDFAFIDIKRQIEIEKISSLSAGQKAIIHLILEAYGREDLKGGLVIIDEPEIHLHYQFQDEYLKIIEKLNNEQGAQYILVTHSESLINSKTIDKVIRFSLDKKNYTKINNPSINTAQYWLIRILDIKKATNVFFGTKVLLVEGETDYYFFRAVLNYLESRHKKGLVQDVTVINIDGRDNIKEWKELFEMFGLKVFYVTDLDYAYNFYSRGPKVKLNNSRAISDFIINHSDIYKLIENEYKNNIFVLKHGGLEEYLGFLNKAKMKDVIDFCEKKIPDYLNNIDDEKVVEIKLILNKIIKK